MSYVTATLRPSRKTNPGHAPSACLGLIAQEMARYAPDVAIKVIGLDGSVTAVFGRPPETEDVTLF